MAVFFLPVAAGNVVLHLLLINKNKPDFKTFRNPDSQRSKTWCLTCIVWLLPSAPVVQTSRHQARTRRWTDCSIKHSTNQQY